MRPASAHSGTLFLHFGDSGGTLGSQEAGAGAPRGADGKVQQRHLVAARGGCGERAPRPGIHRPQENVVPPMRGHSAAARPLELLK